jgi:LPS-assembly protein
VSVKIKFYGRLKIGAFVKGLGLAIASFVPYSCGAEASDIVLPVRVCAVERDAPLTDVTRDNIAQCLGWHVDTSSSICHGSYDSLSISPLHDADEVRVMADEVTLSANGRSKLQGDVEVRQLQRKMNAETAYIYRDAKTNTVTQIELLGRVRYVEPDRLLIAKKVSIHLPDKSSHIEEVLYLFKTDKAGAILPAWGRASLFERFANQNDLLQKATYTTCSPKDKAWQLEASELTLDHVNEKGVARNAVLRIRDWPVFYTPYFSFPTTHKRKSGFLMPLPGYSNVGGFDLALPYYWNIAPNYDATIVPHLYSRRGVMLGGDTRFLNEHSSGSMGGNFLSHDKAFHEFITGNQTTYPSLRGLSDDRWSFFLRDSTTLSNRLQMNINFRQVSDDYYLQDFSSNLDIVTQNQLLRQADVTYSTDHWLLGGVVQSYQTLHPINQSTVADIYERLPQLSARASYNDLPLRANFNMLAEFDYYRWPGDASLQPQGPRYHLNPILSFPHLKPWGYMTPSLQLVENYYDVNQSGLTGSKTLARSIPRYSLDSGLTFERSTALIGKAFLQTLEPRLFYLYVPFRNQTSVPVYDSAYMIFNHDQLFRSNRFSGIDRIGDANQLAYALTSRWLSEQSGLEKASFSIGQMRYFADRRVPLCYQSVGGCVDSPLMLGYVSPVAKSSPITSRAVYQLSPHWVATGDYVWDVSTRSTNNGNLNLHYQPANNHLVSLSYTYLTDGNLFEVNTAPVQNNALHQATLAYAWPLTERLSGLGAYSYNISKSYSMMTFLGLQYDSCCWAMRLIGGRTFQSISPNTLLPQYNNNIYFQILLKGLGSVASSDPASVIGSYLPGYTNIF